MEIKITTNQILKILYVVSWIIFVGVSVEAGMFIFNGFFTLVINPVNASFLNLSGLYKYDHGYYFTEIFLISIVAVLRAIMFYLIVKMLHDKKLDMSQPFNTTVRKFMLNISYLALGIGLFCFWAVQYTAWYIKHGIDMPDIQTLRIAGADVWLFMGVVLFVIAQIFKKGIEIQSENELTV